MSEKQSNERLASLEAKLEILLELIKEIRQDLKTNPTREEFNTLTKEVEDNKKEQADQINNIRALQDKTIAKVAYIAGSVSVIVAVLVGIIEHFVVK